MSKRLGWLLGVVVLVAIGVLVACGSNYDASSDGLMLVGSQGSGLIETFSFNLGTGSNVAVSNTPQDTSNEVCILGGLPSSLVVDAAGAYAYAIINREPLCDTTTPPFTSTTGILAFKVNSDGSTTVVGTQPVGFNPENVVVQGTSSPVPPVVVVPSVMVIDPAGKFLFVADRATTTPPPTPPNTIPQGLYVPGAVSVFAIGSGGTVTEVAGSPFFTSTSPSTLAQSGLDIVSVAPTPTVLPPIGINGVHNSVCSSPALNPPTSEYLYAVDGLGNQVFEFMVNTTSGVLTNPGNGGSMPAFGTGTTPAGVAVDPCDRFAYVTDSFTEQVSAYTICSVVTPTCPLADGSLVPVTGSPFGLSGSVNGAGPIVVDPYGNYVYVLGTLSGTISPLTISPISGKLTPFSTPTNTGLGPRSIAIRADDSWMFVTNFGSTTVGGNTVSQYAITPLTGQLTQLPAIQTDNYPWGVAVK